jgi:zinc protease
MQHQTLRRLVGGLLILVTLFLAPPALADSAPLPPGVQYVTAVEGISEYHLDNGLRVLLFPDASKPTLTVNITYLVGSRHENYGETGMAHLLEHLVFKGTPTHPNIPEEFKQRGARWNGSTWLDRTNYFELVPASDDNLRWAISLEADSMVNSFIARKDLDSEMTVVRNEFEMGENSPFRVMLKRLQSIAYDWHAYGRDTIGNRSDIENVKIENLQAFYRTYYQPDNAVLLLAGKFDTDKALAFVAESFGKIPKPSRVLPPFWTVEPTQDGERNFMVRRKADEQLVMVAYKVPAALHLDATALAVANPMLAGTPTGRLHKSLVETGKAAQVFGFQFNLYAPSLALFGAVVKKGEPVEPVRDAIIREVEGLGGAAPTAQELERVKQQVQKQLEHAFNNHEQIGIMLSEYIALGDWRLFFVGRARVANMSAEAIGAAAKKYFRRDNRTVGIFQPEDTPQRADIPAAPALSEVLKEFKPRQAAAAGEVFEPTPANIQARTRFAQAGGLKVALLPKKNRGETVSVSIRLNWGDEKSLFGKKAIGDMMSGLIDKGTDKMSREQLSDARDKLKMTGGFFDFQTTRSNLDAALRLAAHAMRDASFPESEFEQLRKQMLTGAESQKNDPNARASELLGQHFNRYPKGDWRYRGSIDEAIADIQAVKLEEVRAMHKAFYGASHGQVAIVGDFDADATLKVLQAEFGPWKSQQPYSHILRSYADVSPARLIAPTPDKENAVFLARLNIDIKDDAPDFAALQVANHIIGGGQISSRLGDRLRQKDGLSYGVGSWLTAHALDNAGDWGVYAIAAPQNLAKVEAGMREEVGRALKEGFTAKEVADAVEGMLKLRLQNRAQDNRLTRSWADLMFLDRSYGNWVSASDQALVAVTPESALAAARKYINPEKLSIAVGGDPAKLPKQ